MIALYIKLIRNISEYKVFAFIFVVLVSAIRRYFENFREVRFTCIILHSIFEGSFLADFRFGLVWILNVVIEEIAWVAVLVVKLGVQRSLVSRGWAELLFY